MLRPYQYESLQAVKDKLKDGVTRQLISLPTGTGKTVVFACLPDFLDNKKKIMVLVQRDELANQAVEKIQHWNPNYKIGVEMAERESSPYDNVVVASVATIGRKGSSRIEKFNPEEFGVFVIDEAHHSVADSYKRILEYFNLMAPDSKTLLLGVTATPRRGDGQALGQVYDQIVYEMTMERAIKEGWLVDMKGFKIPTNVDLSMVKKTAGDYNLKELEDKVNTPYRNDIIVQHWANRALDRKTVVFCVDIQHAQDMSDAFVRNGYKAEAIWGDDPDRKAKLKRHRAGTTQILCNCGILTEGYDDPSISCIVMGRPTESELLYQQMAGRGARLPEGCANLIEALARGDSLSKVDCLLLDAVDNTGKHSLVTLGTIFGLPPKMDLQGKSVVVAKERLDKAVIEAGVPPAKLKALESIDHLDELVREVNLFIVKFSPEVEENSKLVWKNMLDGSYLLLLPNGESCTIQQNLLEKWDVHIQVNGSIMDRAFDNLPDAFRWADDKVAMLGKEHLKLLRRDAKWTGNPASASQLSLLRKFYGSRVPTNLTKGEASNLITDFIARTRKKL